MKQAKLDSFFYQSTLTVLIASILSVNFYSLYWYYKQWKTVGLSEGKKPHPIVATIFSPFTAFVLFRKVWRAAPLKSVKSKSLFLIPAVFLLLAAVLDVALSIMFFRDTLFVFLLSLGLATISSLQYAWVQKVINSTAPKASLVPKKLHLNPPEIVFLVVGFVLVFLNIPVVLFLPSSDTIMQRTAEFQKVTDVLTVKYNALDTKYTSCSNDINAQYEVLDFTDQTAIDTYNKDLDTCQNVLKERDAVGNEINRRSGELIQSLFQK